MEEEIEVEVTDGQVSEINADTTDNSAIPQQTVRSEYMFEEGGNTVINDSDILDYFLYKKVPVSIDNVPTGIARKTRQRKNPVSQFVMFTPHTAYESNKKDLPGRNDPCMCGSGKKYKKCCGS